MLVVQHPNKDDDNHRNPYNPQQKLFPNHFAVHFLPSVTVDALTAFPSRGAACGLTTD